MKKSIPVGVLAAALLLAGCSSTGSSSDSPATDHEQTLTTYFNALATEKAATMAPMLTAAAPGSAAYIYAEHQINLATANEAANNTPQPDNAIITGDSVTLRAQGIENATDEQKAASTSVYRDFTYSAEGLVETWNAEPGGALAPRISAQTGSVTAAGVTITLRTAYQANVGDLYVTYDARNKGAKKVSVNPSGYVNPDGRQVRTATTGGTLDLQPGAFTTDAVSITSGKPGGTLIFQVDYQTNLKVRVS